MRDLGSHDLLMLALSTRVCSVLLASMPAAASGAARRLATQPRRCGEGGDAKHAACRERRALALQHAWRAASRVRLRRWPHMAERSTLDGTTACRSKRYGTAAHGTAARRVDKVRAAAFGGGAEGAR